MGLRSAKELSLSRQQSISVLVISVLLGAGWLLLTRATALTYHFFPLIIAASTPALPAMLFGLRLRRPSVGLMATLGLTVVGITWTVMHLGGFAPTATFVDGQPGGVGGEVVFLALVGAAWGSRYATRSR